MKIVAAIIITALLNWVMAIALSLWEDRWSFRVNPRVAATVFALLSVGLTLGLFLLIGE